MRGPRLAVLYCYAADALRAKSLHAAQLKTHAKVLGICTDALRSKYPGAEIHVEPTIGALPEAYGLPRSGPYSVLTPDVVCRKSTAAGAASTPADAAGVALVADDAAKSSLTIVLEVTVVPDGAVEAYAQRKYFKYAVFKKQRCDVYVVALGTGGAVPYLTHAAIGALCDDAAEREALLQALVKVARSRADAPKRRRRRHGDFKGPARVDTVDSKGPPPTAPAR